MRHWRTQLSGCWQDLELAETRSLPFVILLMILAFRGERHIAFYVVSRCYTME